MATIEQAGFLKYKDNTGNTYLVLPITTKDNVDGIDEIEAAIEALQTLVVTKAAASDLTSHTGDKTNPHGVTKSQVGLGNVENKSSATIRGELTKANVTDALGYTPPTTNTTYDAATTTSAGLMSATDKVKLNGIAAGANAYTHPSTHSASMITGLATVATSGNYYDLDGRPTVFTGATETANGMYGLVPGPVAGYQDHYLRGDCRWVKPQLGALDDGAGNITLTFG